MARAVGLIWLGGGLAATAALAGFTELRSSRLQATLWSLAAREASYRVEAGPSPRISFPGDGPYDERMGYSALPQHLERLQQQGFVIASQARQSPQLLAMAGQGLFIPYREKSQAGLLLLDCRGEALLALRQPQRQYARFEDIPPLLVQTLLFIEDRHLLDEDAPRRNPALDPERFGKAALQQLQQRIDASRPASGGSTPWPPRSRSTATRRRAAPARSARSCARWPRPRSAPIWTASRPWSASSWVRAINGVTGRSRAPSSSACAARVLRACSIRESKAALRPAGT